MSTGASYSESKFKTTHASHEPAGGQSHEGEEQTGDSAAEQEKLIYGDLFIFAAQYHFCTRNLFIIWHYFRASELF